LTEKVDEYLDTLLVSARQADREVLRSLQSALAWEAEQWATEGQTGTWASLIWAGAKFAATRIAATANKQKEVGEILRETDRNVSMKYAETFGRVARYIWVLPASDLFELISESKKRGNGLIQFLEKVETRGKLAISKGAKFPSARDYHAIKPPRIIYRELGNQEALAS